MKLRFCSKVVQRGKDFEVELEYENSSIRSFHDIFGAI